MFKNKCLTHRVAVNAFLIHKNRFLLLKRTKKPLIWGPPGGRLYLNEDPYLGLKREVIEETGLDLEIIAPVVTWFGKFNRSSLLSLDYLCLTDRNNVDLSDEHDVYLWLSLDELKLGQREYFTPGLGFSLSDFYSAWKIYLLYCRRWKDLERFGMSATD